MTVNTKQTVGIGAILLIAGICCSPPAFGGYIETYQTWSATSAATWQVKSLSGAPYDVPPNAVLEIAVFNDNMSYEREGGVRTVGSSLNRRFSLHEAEGAGWDVVVMHVQTDASSRIEHYAQNTSDVGFILLGYWLEGTYVEAFQSFTAGTDAAWRTHDMGSYGVNSKQVVEIVMVNTRATDERQIGVRTNGSTFERIVNVHEPEDGGVDMASMFVQTDAARLIEVYAEVDGDVDFYLVGYWSTPPGAFKEMFAKVDSPTTDGTWEDEDLSGLGVKAEAVLQIVLSNQMPFAENNMGVRRSGCSTARVFDLQEAESGGGDFGTMHVSADADVNIQVYHEDVSDTHDFLLVGSWKVPFYSVVDLGTLTGEPSFAFGLNSAGEVAGFDEDDVSDEESAWIWQEYGLTGLGALVGGSQSAARDVNDATEVVGWAEDAAGNRRAFIWDSSSGMSELGTLAGRSDSEAHGINASSEVVGIALNYDAPPTNHLAFLYLPSAAYGLPAGMNSLGTLGGNLSVAMGLNDSAEVVGGAENGSGYIRPFLWLPSAAYGLSAGMNDLGTLGSDSGTLMHRAYAVNNSGEVVGLSFTAGGDPHAFLWLPSAAYGLSAGMNDLGTLTGGDFSCAFGINDAGQVVGVSNVTSGDQYAFLWENGTMTDLNNMIAAGSGWELTWATDINDDARIVGWGTNGSSDTRGYRLTPQGCTPGGMRTSLAASTYSQSDPGTDEDPPAAQEDHLITDSPPESPVLPPLCGLGMWHSMSVILLGLMAGRTRRSGSSDLCGRSSQPRIRPLGPDGAGRPWPERDPCDRDPTGY